MITIYVIAEPIANIINTTFISRTFPTALKKITITPIPKVENPTNKQFRPIRNANFLLNN